MWLVPLPSLVFILGKKSSLEFPYESGKICRMKSLPTIFTLVFSVMFSSTSFAEWTEVGVTSNGYTHYLDLERIRKHKGFIYWWDMIDQPKPDEKGTWSRKAYMEGDCKLFRYRYLSISIHKEPMVGGTGVTHNYDDEPWEYPPPNSAGEVKLKSVCSR